jgi:heptosyltransferase-2
MAELAAAVAAARGMDVVVIGGPENAGPAHDVAARIAATDVRAAPAAGSLGLRENAALAGSAALFIGMDSGPGHMAAALGVPVVTIGAHPEGASAAHPSAPERFAPWAPAERRLVLRPPAHRPPCSDGCDADAPHCILGIGVADVLPRVLDFAVRTA